MAYPGTFVAGQVLTAAEMNAINEGASARPLLTGGAYIDGTNGLVLSGLSGNYATSPDSAALSITGDIDIKCKVTMDDWTPSAAQTVVSKYLTTVNQRAYRLDVNTSGTLQLYTSPDGVNFVTSASSVATGFADGSTKWIRATLDVDDGAGNRVAKFYTSDNGTTWTQLGTTVTTAGTTSIFDSTGPLDIGVLETIHRFAGTIHRVIIQSGFDTADNTTNVVFDADFEAEAADTLAFTEDSANAATVSVTTTRYTVGIPGSEGSSLGTTTATLNQDRYGFFTVTDAIDVDMLAFEVTTGPSSAATVYLGLYEADDNYNPTGAPITTASVSVGTSATGVFYAQVTPVTLTAGAYVVGINPSQTMTVRYMRGSGALLHTLGSSAFLFALIVARTAATFPTNPPVPNSRTASSSPFGFPVFLRWKAA